VEAQHLVSTRKLVASLEEQALLEELIDGAKPPVRGESHAHYLLTTPFRYPPLRHGSRFGGRHEPSLWYGSVTRSTALTEVAYYRLVFLEGTTADLGVVPMQLTAFTVHARSARGVDLVAAPFDEHRRAIASPSRYDATQALGASMRAAGVELFRYPSARDPEGVNVAAFTAAAFGNAKPREFEAWDCLATRDGVECAKRDYFRRESFTFSRAQFLVRGQLPAPALA
jgi:hypothetical protein